MSNTTSTKVLDHIVHLTPPGSVQETSEQFRNLGFKVLPGGTHTDGFTANALVILADGVYLELLSFTHPPSHYPSGTPERQQRDGHPWASKSPGWIDYAFLGNGSLTMRISDIINERAKKDGSGAVYAPEWPSGRERPDGRVLKWVMTTPQQHGRGMLPFFCGDVTPREWRVPNDPPSNTEHPSTASGISHIRILTSPETLTTISHQLTSVIGSEPISFEDGEFVWRLETVREGQNGPMLILGSPEGEEEAGFVVQESIGIYEVGFLVKNGEGGRATTPHGKIVWIPEN